MGQDPDAIRQEIEQTRAEMGDTIEAIGYKTDVKARARDSVDERKAAIRGKVSSVMGRANDATPSGDDVKQAVSVAQENPLGLAIGAVAVGFVAGMLVPSTRVEDEKLGPVSDEVKDKVRETGQEALEHGKQVAQDVAQSAQETAKSSGQEHAQELASTASPSQ